MVKIRARVRLGLGLGLESRLRPIRCRVMCVSKPSELELGLVFG